MFVRRTTAQVSLLLLITTLIGFVPALSHAQAALDVSPIVVDEKAKARDILKKTITITNASDRKLNVYPSVNDVDALEGTEEFVSAQTSEDRSDSLANWIELSRGVVEIAPGESKEIPFVIRVNLSALPGTYHADVSFYEGSTREEAEKGRPLATVTVNTEVQADVKEIMQLNKFLTDSFFFSGDDVLFTYQLENIGNQELKPKGDIRIYDRKGREVATIPLNSEGHTFTPEEAGQLAAAWTAAEGFGKFKAFLNVDYGNNTAGSLQDTVYFWIIPWQQLLAVFAVSFIAITVSALYFHRWLEHRHMQKFALVHGIQGAAMQAPPGMIVPPKTVPPIEPHPSSVPIPAVSEAQPRRRFFGLLKPKKPAEQTVAVAAATMQAPAVPHGEATVPHGVEIKAHEEVAPMPPAQTAAPRQAVHTIDLKSVAAHSEQSAARRTTHVINLKNGA